MGDSIESYRAEINSIDEQLLSLLAKRFEVALSIGGIKREMGAQVLDATREAQVIEGRGVYGEALGVDPEFTTQLFTLILKQSRKVQGELQ